MELFTELFTDSAGLSVIFTMVLLLAIPAVIVVYVLKAMNHR